LQGANQPPTIASLAAVEPIVAASPGDIVGIVGFATHG
jgi:hypothetical protein